jgi:hypothetical protein
MGCQRGHWRPISLLDDALGGHDPQTVVRLYAAPADADPFSEATIRLDLDPLVEHQVPKFGFRLALAAMPSTYWRPS